MVGQTHREGGVTLAAAEFFCKGFGDDPECK